MTQSFKLVDVPAPVGGKVAGPNPFEPAAQAAVQAQAQGKAIAFPLDLMEFKDVTTIKDVDGVMTETKKTARQQAEAYAIRKIRELGVKLNRTFTVVIKGDDVIVSAKERITREKKAKTTDDASVTEA